MLNNHAAGSGMKGVGIWYLFPDAPVGPSVGLFFKKREAKHTAITLFENNVAHSNGQLGLGVFRRLREDHGLLGCSTYNPRENPLDRHSELVPARFEGFTGGLFLLLTLVMFFLTSHSYRFQEYCKCQDANNNFCDEQFQVV